MEPRRRLATSVLGLLLVASGCTSDGREDALFLRLEPTGLPYTAGGSTRTVLWKDRVWRRAENGVYEVRADGDHEVGQFRHATPTPDALYALGDTGVWKSLDGETFTQVSTETFTELGAVADRLVALRPQSFGSALVFISRDGGVTWTQAPEGIDAGNAAGTGWNRSISHEVNGFLRLGVTVWDDSHGNVEYWGQTYELIGEAIQLVGRLGGASPMLPAPWPELQAPEGLAFFRTDDLPDQQGDATNLVVLDRYSRGDDVAGARRLRVVRPLLPWDGPASVEVIGLDSEGRLVVGADVIYRSTTPVRDGDQRASILKGPGCESRATFEPDLRNDDSVKVLIRNETGIKVLVRQVDAQHRWQRLGELEPGGEKKLDEWRRGASRQNVRIMVTDPTDESCLGVYKVAMDDESTIVVKMP